jgi:Fur family ferric uptake transcriptional regulator
MPDTRHDALQEKVRETLREYLSDHKLRKTPERFAILEEVYLIDGHFDVESMYIRMKNKNYRVSRATVYNTLDILMDADLIVKHQFGNNLAVYERSYGSKQHDHLICNRCGKIMEFCDPRIQSIRKGVEEFYNFKVNFHALYLYGECTAPACTNKNKENELSKK